MQIFTDMDFVDGLKLSRAEAHLCYLGGTSCFIYYLYLTSKAPAIYDRDTVL